MKKFLRWIFYKKKEYFETLFIEDLFGDIPKEVSDEALKFLSRGSKELDRFFRWNAYLLQRKMQQPQRHAEAYIGGIVFIKTLATLIQKWDNERKPFPEEIKIEATPDVKEAIRGVDEFFERKVETK